MATEVEHGAKDVAPWALTRARLDMARWAAYSGITLLVADHDIAMPEAVRTRLAHSGINVSPYRDAAEALLHIGRDDPDVILLGAKLPLAPATVVAAVRADSSVPILIGCEADDTEIAGAALLAGATALVHRPYQAENLTQVIHHLRPTLATGRRPRSNLTYGPLELSSESFTARLNGRDLRLPLKEFELLRLLMIHADHVVSTNQIRDTLWETSPEKPSSNAVSVHVARLRARIGGPHVLRTVRGLGYRLTFSEDLEDASLEDEADSGTSRTD